MGVKSRGNYTVGICIKKDCANRDRFSIVEGRSYNHCKECAKINGRETEYKKEENLC